MKAVSALLATTVCALLMTHLHSHAQVIGIEKFGPITIVPNQPVELAFPNVFDLTHQKLLTLHAAATGPAGTVTPLSVAFDWLDVTGAKAVSTPTIFNVPGGTPFAIDLAFTIPFCPERVSVDFLSNGAQVTWPIVVTGTFIHECLVPETNTTVPAIAGIGMALGWVWRRGRTAAAA